MLESRSKSAGKLDRLLVAAFVLAVGTLALQPLLGGLFSDRNLQQVSSVAFTSAAASSESPMGFPKIVVEDPVHNFGEVPSGTVITHDFAIRNDGNADLMIRQVQASCGCTGTSLAQETISPGGETTVEVKLDLVNRTGRQNRSVVVFSNDPKSPHYQLTLTGRVEHKR
ncbi:MAG: DUF1573 domain-containing protein [Pirellulales bacterium]|nr:DUF1573 domain-containing protein [Pirellulales bacterium]